MNLEDAYEQTLVGFLLCWSDVCWQNDNTQMVCLCQNFMVGFFISQLLFPISSFKGQILKITQRRAAWNRSITLISVINSCFTSLINYIEQEHTRIISYSWQISSVLSHLELSLQHFQCIWPLTRVTSFCNSSPTACSSSLCSRSPLCASSSCSFSFKYRRHCWKRTSTSLSARRVGSENTTEPEPEEHLREPAASGCLVCINAVEMTNTSCSAPLPHLALSDPGCWRPGHQKQPSGCPPQFGPRWGVQGGWTEPPGSCSYSSSLFCRSFTSCTGNELVGFKLPTSTGNCKDSRTGSCYMTSLSRTYVHISHLFTLNFDLGALTEAKLTC